MSTTSKIEWTDTTWNPVTGCSKISSGCKNCYAEVFARRLRSMGQPRYRCGFQVTVHSDLLELPLNWRKSRRIFVNSMSDLFHEDVPTEFIQSVFKTMCEAHWHIFQVLTKRSGRLYELRERLQWPANVWMGVSVESVDQLKRVRDLQRVPAAVRFLSLEPLISPIPRLPLKGIDWVIVGGESGPHARPMESAWVRQIRDQCEQSKIAFYFKQWGGKWKKKAGRMLDGRTWDELPEVYGQEGLSKNMLLQSSSV